MKLTEQDWEEAPSKIYIDAYTAEDGAMLYSRDTYLESNATGQTEISDWHQDRYEIRHRNLFEPASEPDTVVFSSSDYGEIEDFLEAKI
jgi:hypothetical protein